MGLEFLGKALVTSVVFSLVGMAVFIAGFFVLRFLLPMDIKKEIEHDQNTALGIIIGSFVLGLAFIVGMAIHG
jgi:putative membrane protein